MYLCKTYIYKKTYLFRRSVCKVLLSADSKPCRTLLVSFQNGLPIAMKALRVSPRKASLFCLSAPSNRCEIALTSSTSFPMATPILGVGWNIRIITCVILYSRVLTSGNEFPDGWQSSSNSCNKRQGQRGNTLDGIELTNKLSYLPKNQARLQHLYQTSGDCSVK